jgi:hypothetical protein
MTRNPLFAWLRGMVTLGLLLYVCRKAGLFDPDGRRVLADLLGNVSLPYLLISLLMSVIMNTSSTVKWQMLLRSRGHRVGFWRLMGYYYVGKFFNLALPTSMGGDVMRIWAVGRDTGSATEALASVFVERFSGMVTMTLLVILALVVNHQAYNRPLITVSLGACALAILMVIWLALDARPLGLVTRLAAGRLRVLDAVLAKIEKLHGAIAAYGDDRAALWGAFVNSLIFYALAVINVWVSTLAFSREIDFGSILITVPAILLIMNLPVSIGGIGLMEFAFSFAFDMVGYSSALALSTALLIRFKTFIDGAVGGTLHLLGGRPAVVRSGDTTRSEP